MDDLEVDDLIFSGELDSRGWMSIFNEDICSPIDKEDAKRIITHLANLFDISLSRGK